MNVAASVRQRLYDFAKVQNEDFQRIMTQFALERLLYRLSVSPYAGQFILKGALLFVVWMGEPHRQTRDLDLLGAGDPSPDHLVALFREICALPVEEDGLIFDVSSVAAKRIRDDNLYGGIRITCLVLEKASPLSPCRSRVSFS